MIIRTALILVLLWSTPALALEIAFLQSRSVSQDSILLSDITDVSEQTPLAKALGSQIVGIAPDPGNINVLDAREIINKIEKSHNSRLKGVLWKGSPLITVTRESVTITSEKIQEMIDDYIAENLHRLPDAEITFVPDSLPLPFEIQTGSLSWDIVPSSPQIIGSSRFSIILKVDNKVRKNFSVKGETKAVTSVATASRKLKYGDIITPDMVTIADRDISTLQSYSRSASELIGSVVKRNIQEGSVIGPEDVELPPVIEKGELVRIVVSHGGLLLTAAGIAKSDGHLDEVIRVKNTDSNKLIYCRVQAPGLVEVRL